MNEFICGAQNSYQGELPDAGEGACCYGATDGPDRCTCWREVFDVEQSRPDVGALNRPPVARAEPCADCAYSSGSPEKRGDEHVVGDQDLLDELVRTRQPFWCHDGRPDRPRRIAGWVLRRHIESLSLSPSEWESAASTLGAAIRVGMAASTSGDAPGSFTGSPTRSASVPSRRVSSSCTPATTLPASPSSIFAAELSLRTTLTWLQRGGLSEAEARKVPEPNCPTGRLLSSVADALLARRCEPWESSSVSTTPTSADSPDYCGGLHDVIRRVVALRHEPTGIEHCVPEEFAVAYRPPIIDVPGIGSRPVKADGSPADLCAGWQSRVDAAGRANVG